MIISHLHEFLFLKTRKTASTSVEMALSSHCGIHDTIGRLHRDDEALKRALGLRVACNDLIPFRYWTLAEFVAFIRKRKRPKYREHMPARFVMRSISRDVWKKYFKFCIERNSYDKAISLYYWRTRKLRTPPCFVEFLEAIDANALSNKYIYTVDDVIVVDQVIQYNNLEGGLRTVCKKLGIEKLCLPHAKGGIRPSAKYGSELLTKDACRIIENVCAWEIETFGYAPMERGCKSREKTGVDSVASVENI